MKRALLILLLVLSFPSGAQAGWRVDRATAIARTVWNNPCGGSVKMEWADLSALWHAYGYAQGCTITISTEYKFDWMMFCNTVIHEYGHVAGMNHNANPYSIMYEHSNWDAPGQSVGGITIDGVFYPARIPGGDPRCWDRGRRYLERFAPWTL